MEIHVYATPGDVARAFTSKFLEIIDAKTRFKNQDTLFNLAISGGNTPKDLFRLWSTEYQNKIPWNKINLFWVDERCVPADNDESNFKMTSEYLLNHVPIPEKNIHRIIGETVPSTEAKRYSSLLKKYLAIKNGAPVFDMVLLGIGEDGHTASIFPGNPDLLISKKLCEVTEHPVTGQKRITLTIRVLNNADYIAFIVTGENKAKVLSDILKRTAESMAYPASYITPSEYYLDKAASSYL